MGRFAPKAGLAPAWGRWGRRRPSFSRRLDGPVSTGGLLPRQQKRGLLHRSKPLHPRRARHVKESLYRAANIVTAWVMPCIQGNCHSPNPTVPMAVMITAAHTGQAILDVTASSPSPVMYIWTMTRR